MRLLKRLLKRVPTSPRGVFGALILAPMLYAGFALVASTPARAAGVSGEACRLVSCSFDETTCHLQGGGVGVCCIVCYGYECDDGTTPSQCRTECGAQC